MSQVADYVIANASGATVRADINTTLLAVVSNNSGSSEPGTMYAFMLWVDTTTNLIKLRNAANSAWITLGVSITASNTVDVNGGSIDGTPIGASSASTGAFTTLSATGASNLDSSVTINESGADVDFRVESDSYTHMLFVDGGNNQVGIGGSVTNSVLDIHTAASTAKPTALRFTNAGDINYAWEFWRDNTDGDLRFGEEINGTHTTRVTFETGGNVGIGTATPNESGFGGDSQVLSIQGASADNFGVLELISPDVTGSNRIGEIRFGNLDGGSSFASNAGIRAFRDGADNSSAMSLWTTNAGTFSEKMSITSSGNVGIGKTGPDNILSIHQNDATSNAYVHITQEDGGSTSSDGLSIGVEDGGVNAVIRNREDGYLRMFTNNTEKMRILSNGEMQLKGGTYLAATGVQSLAFTNGSFSVADNSTLTLTDIANTGCLVAIGQNRSSSGVTYDHCLVFAEHSTALTMIANPSGRFGTSSGTDTITNIYMSAASMIIENKVGSSVTYSVAIFRFLGN